MTFVVVPLILVVAVGLAWTWWTSRVERDPVSSVTSFERALAAMQPRRSGEVSADAEPREPA